jgi:hypothetical protein
LRQVTDADIVDYDCAPNAADMIRCYGGEFADIVCVTWNTEDTTRLESEIGSGPVMRIADTTPELPAKGRTIAGNNKYRQFLSTLKGLERLAASGCTHAIKVRSDQSLDLQRMRDHLIETVGERGARDRILTVGCNRSRPDELPDFYFGGAVDRLIDACRVYMDEPELFDLVHPDLFYRWAWWFDGGGPRPPGRAYTPSGRHTKAQLAVIRSAWSRLYGAFPREIFAGMVWRGAAFPDPEVDRYAFADTAPEALDDLICQSVDTRAVRRLRHHAGRRLPGPLRDALKKLAAR